MIGKVEIDYTNYKGERAKRVIKPIAGTMVMRDAPPWHPNVEWVFSGLDVERNVVRTFTLKDIHSWTPVADVPEPVPEWPTGCVHPNSCYRAGRCNYARCRWQTADVDLVAAMAKSKALASKVEG